MAKDQDGVPENIFRHGDDALDVFEQLGDGVIVIDRSGRVVFFNDAAEQAFGYDRAEIIGRNMSILLPEGERAEHQSYLRQSTLHASRIINQVRDLWGRRKDGSLFPMELNVTPIASPGESSRYMGLFRDISARKDLELRLIEERNAAEAARHDALAASQAKSQFLSVMSHELRTPLNAILGFGQMLGLEAVGGLNDKQQEYLTHILGSGRHLLAMVEELLELSRIEAGRAELSIQSLDPGDIVNEALETARILAIGQQISVIDMRPASSPVKVQADPVRLKQILLNLLSNAVKYNRPHGEVHLEVEHIEGFYLRFVISDTGIGIAADKVGDLFSSFHRLGAESSTVEGTGIGLFLTRNLVRMMKGNIGFETQEGQGSTFWFELPVADATDQNQQSGIGESVTLTFKSGKILFVEENPVNLRLVEAVARTFGDLTLLPAHSTDIALALAETKKPAVIIIDLDLPGVNSVHLIQALSDNPTTAQIPRIVLAESAASQEPILRAGLSVAHSIDKPLQIDILRNALMGSLLDPDMATIGANTTK